jgi:hypothetical protein
MMSALALSGLARGVLWDPLAAAILGACVGLVYALLVAPRFEPARLFASTAVGVVGIASGLWVFLGGSACHSGDMLAVVLAFLGLLAAAAVGAGLRWATVGFPAEAMLATYAAGRLVSILASSAGLSTPLQPITGWVLIAGLTLLFGVLAGIATRLVIAMSALCLLAASAAATITDRSLCATGTTTAELALIACAGGAVMIARLVWWVRK